MNLSVKKAVPLCAMLLLLLSSCSSSKPAKIAGKAEIDFGSAVQAGDILDPKAAKFITDNFNMIVPENSMKWEYLRPTKDFWNWPDVDTAVKFAEKNKLKIKWHVLLWHKQLPDYAERKMSRSEALALMVEQIETVMTRYRGRVQEYEIVNEPIEEDGSMRKTCWYENIGPDYIDIAFTTARKADPDAKLILNDFNNHYMGTPKGDAFYALVKGMVERGVPIDAVGFQLHIIADPFDEAALLNNIRRYNELGIDVTFTEIDVRILLPVTPEKEKIQFDIYSTLMNAALSEKNARSFILWGYTDKRSWVPASFPEYGSACPFDKQIKPKPVYNEMIRLMKQSR